MRYAYINFVRFYVIEAEYSKKSGKSVITDTVDRCPPKVDRLNIAQGATEYIKFHEIWYFFFRATLVIKGFALHRQVEIFQNLSNCI